MRLLVTAGVLAFSTLGSASAAAQRALPRALEPFVQVNDEVVALVGVRVIDGTGGPAQTAQTIVLRENRIERVGPQGSVVVPAGARVLNLPGHTVFPGYVMLHEHMFYGVGRAAYNQQEFSFPKLYLAGGATTIRTGGSRDPYGDLNLKRAIDAGEAPGPRIHVTGPYVNGPGLPILFVNAVRDAEDARRLVRYWADEGATSFKAYQQITRAELAAVIDEAHARGLKVTGHLCSVTYREAADLGIDNLEHGFRAATDFVVGKQPDRCPDGSARTRALDRDVKGPEAQALIQHLVARGVAVTSTLIVTEALTPGRPLAPQGVLDVMAALIRDQYLQAWSALQRNGTRGDWPISLAKEMEFGKAFADAGGLLVAGTDPTSYGGIVAGFANQREVELLRESGFSPERAIQIATLNGARYLGIADDLGTVQEGKRADLVLVEGDPTSDITAVRNVRLVFKDGIGYDPKRLIQAVQGVVGLY